MSVKEQVIELVKVFWLTEDKKQQDIQVKQIHTLLKEELDNEL
jgi:hypothetical protein